MGRSGRASWFEEPSYEEAPHGDEHNSDEEKMVKSSVRLGMWDFAQCDPKRCSGRRLCRLKVIEEFKLSTKFKGIILTYEPYEIY